MTKFVAAPGSPIQKDMHSALYSRSRDGSSSGQKQTEYIKVVIVMAWKVPPCSMVLVFSLKVLSGPEELSEKFSN